MPHIGQPQKVLIFLGCLLFIGVAIAALVLAVQNHTQEDSFTPNEVSNLIKINENVQITENDCVAAQCFTDQFVQRVFQQSVQQAIQESVVSSVKEYISGIQKDNVFGIVIIQDSLQVPLIQSNGDLTVFAPQIDLSGYVDVSSGLTLANVSTSERNMLLTKEGMIVYDTTLNQMFIFQGGVWTSLSQQGFVLSVAGTANNINVTGTLSNPIVNLAVVSTIVPNTYNWPQVTIDAFGRVVSITSNIAPIASITGTAGQIDITNGSNPIVSLDATLFAGIENWITLQPITVPSNSQFLMYQNPRLVWTNIGTSPYPNGSRNIYVDKSGNDTTGNGTNLFPFLTIGKAVSVALASPSLTAANQMAIIVGAGNYIELNPINITKTGITIFGSSLRATFVIPNDPTQPLFVTNNVNIMFSQLRFDAFGLSSTSTCVTFTNMMNSFFGSCLFRGFQNVFNLNGTGTITSLVVVDSCTFVQNQNLSTCLGTIFIINDCQITGASSTESISSTYNGFTTQNDNTFTYISDCFFTRLGFCVHATNQSYINVSGGHCGESLQGIVVDTGGMLSCTGCDFSKWEAGQVATSCTGPGSILTLIACHFDGRNMNFVVSGVGIQVNNQGTVNANSCNITYCTIGALVGLSTDTSSTSGIFSNSSFAHNTTSVHVQGTSTFGGVFITIDSLSTAIFDSTQNINLIVANFDTVNNAWIEIGPWVNQQIDLLGIATKPTNSPDLRYQPSIYSCECLQFYNPDPTVSSSFANVSQTQSFVNVITQDITQVCGLNLYSDSGNPIGTIGNVRGWSINKLGSSGNLTFNYTNAIAGQPIVSNHPWLFIDPVNGIFNVTSAKITFSGGTNLYEQSSNVLKTDSNFVIGSLTNPNCVMYADTNKQLTTSNVTLTELSYLSGVTSSIQTQLNSKLSVTGGTLTGQINSTFSGTNVNPNYSINGSNGFYSLASGHFTIATSSSNRLDIDATGNVTWFNFATQGILHVNGSGLMSTSLIVDADITTATITNDKLAAISSSNNANFIVVRDGAGNFITNMITLLGTTTNPTDAATKSYVDQAVATGFEVHPSVIVLSTTNSALSGLLTIDGVTLVNGNRVLLIGQTNAIENGCWVAASGSWTRPTDFNTGTLAGSAYFLVTQGTTNAGTSWVCSTSTAIIDTNPLSFSEFSQPSSSTGTNDGSGSGLIYSTTVGNVLHFRSLLAGSAFMIVTNDTNDVTLDVNQSSSNTASTLVSRDSFGNFSANVITASLVGHASLDLPLTGGTLTGSLQVPNGSSVNPSLQIGSNAVGFSNNSGTLQFSTASALVLSLDTSGNLTLPIFTTTGVVHNNSSGLFSSSLIVDADITTATITNDKLATISASNVINNIVVRDSSGNFSANVITATLFMGNGSGTWTGNVVGHASLDLALSGGTLTGNVLFPNGTSALPSVQIGTNAIGLSALSGGLQFSTNSTLALTINSAGTLIVPSLNTIGLVHSSSGGILTSSLLVDADITTATITNDKLANISSANIANDIVVRDGSGNFSAGTITATISGHASGDLPLTGGTLTGALILINGTFTNPGLQFGNANSGLSVNGGSLQFTTGGLLSMSLDTSSNLSIASLTTTGIVHNNTNGTLSTSLIVNADITIGTITNDRLATISSTNTANNIVVRDSSGNFSANIITASITGHASLDLPLSGGTLTGSLVTINGTIVAPAIQIGSSAVGISNNTGILQISTNSTLAVSIGTTGVVTIANLTSQGLVHNSAAGVLTTSLLVDADITSGTITNDKLANISSTNIANNIVVRDSSGNFAASTITSNVIGSLTGHASLDLPLAGGTLSGTLSLGGNPITNILSLGTSTTNIQIGNTSTVGTSNCVVIGNGATISAANTGSIVMGGGANINGSSAVIIGFNASGGTGAIEQIAIGSSANASGNDSIAIGKAASVTVANGIVIGSNTTLNGTFGVSIGHGNSITSFANIYGSQNTSGANNADIFGSGITNNTANSLLIGNASYVNIRPASTTTDLGTTSTGFQNIFASGSLTSTSGSLNTRLVDNIVSTTSNGTVGNVPTFSSSKSIVDSGTALSSLATTSSLANYVLISGSNMTGTLGLTNLDSTSTTINIGPTLATSVVLGRSGQTVQSVGTFFTGTIPKGSMYSVSTLTPNFVAGVVQLLTFTGSVANVLNLFTQSNGQLVSGSSRTRTMRITWNITFKTGNNNDNMTFFSSLNGSLTLAAAQTRCIVNVDANNANREQTYGFTDQITVANTNTIQLAASCSSNSTNTSFQFVSCLVEGLLD